MLGRSIFLSVFANSLFLSATLLSGVMISCYRIVYRDIKPDNIGFDVRGDVKIFDLGLAKELGCSKNNGDGTYNLTGDTGSPRYVLGCLL